MKRVIIALIFSLCVLLSCSQKQSSTEEDRLTWNKETLVGSYEKLGNKSPKWDEPTTNALIEFARIRGGMHEDVDAQSEVIADYSEDAVKAGCDDPMVLYLYCRFNMSRSTRPLSYWQDEYRKTAQTLESSGYPPLRKFYANIRAATVVWQNRDQAVWQEVTQFRRQSMADLALALQDKSLPIEEAFTACEALLGTIETNPKELPDAWKMLEPPLFKNWPRTATANYIKGRFNYELAWRARGGGYADSIPADAWKTFGEDLKVAEQAYQRAWELDPKDPRIATEMIEMAVSQQKPREEMELWFGRAMQLDTNNYSACLKKLRYLRPEWYGNREEMLKFGRECVASPAWGGRVSLILVDAHLQLADRVGSAYSAGYWLQPDVWTDVQSAYEKALQVNPNPGDLRYYYAKFAFRCEQWEDFKEQINLIRASEKGFNPAFFGGEEQFNKMLAQAGSAGTKN